MIVGVNTNNGLCPALAGLMTGKSALPGSYVVGLRINNGDTPFKGAEKVHNVPQLQRGE